MDDFFSLCTRTREWRSKTIKLKYPTTIPKTANAQEAKIGQLSALLGDFSAKIIKEPTNIGLRDKFEKIEKEKAELIKVVSKEHLESKMKHMTEGVQRCSKDFFKITGQMMARDKFSSVTKNSMTSDEKKKKLDANDITFTSKERSFGHDIDDYKSITPDRKFTVKGWCPDDVEDNHPIADTLNKAKMNKSDYSVFLELFDYYSRISGK